MTTYLDELSVQSVQEAVKKITNHYHWKGPVGVSVTRAVTRVLGNQAAGKQLEVMMPDSKGKVATMIPPRRRPMRNVLRPGRECSALGSRRRGWHGHRDLQPRTEGEKLG